MQTDDEHQRPGPAESPDADTREAGDPPAGVPEDRAPDAPVTPSDRDASAGELPPPGDPATPAVGETGTPTVDDVLEGGPPEPEVSDHLVAVIEALVFASPEPITQKQIFKLLDTEPKEDVLAALAELGARYDARGGGLQLVQVANGYQIVTRPELADSVRRMFHERTTQKLSIAALETLAVIAYKQPITAAEITEIRGVNTSGVIGTLLERGQIKISGRKQVVGRPFLYATTREFLDRFGLRDLADLPRVEDMAGALGFDVPAGLQTEAAHILPLADEPATAEDAAVLSGEGGAEDGAEAPAEDEETGGGMRE
jgi:segregation and condensation protein B